MYVVYPTLYGCACVVRHGGVRSLRSTEGDVQTKRHSQKTEDRETHKIVHMRVRAGCLVSSNKQALVARKQKTLGYSKSDSAD